LKGSSAHLPVCLGLHSPLIAILAELQYFTNFKIA